MTDKIQLITILRPFGMITSYIDNSIRSMHSLHKQPSLKYAQGMHLVIKDTLHD